MLGKKISHLGTSFQYLIYFYLPVFLLAFVFLYPFYNMDLWIAAAIILGGNLFLGLFTQTSNYIIEKYSDQGIVRDYLYHNFVHAFFRSLAGLSEITLYAVFFATGFESVVGGYLLLKTVSIWQGDYNNKKEWLHTAILRSAIVIALLIGLAASYYLKQYINL